MVNYERLETYLANFLRELLGREHPGSTFEVQVAVMPDPFMQPEVIRAAVRKGGDTCFAQTILSHADAYELGRDDCNTAREFHIAEYYSLFLFQELIDLFERGSAP